MYAVLLQVVLFAYFRQETQHRTGRQVHWEIKDMLSLILEIDSSFSWFSRWDSQCKLPVYILSILFKVVM